MRLLFSLLLVILSSTFSFSQNTGVSDCSQGWVVPTATQSENGACGLPVPEGIGRVSLSTLGFNSGASCGECYEIIGPNGTVVVMAFDTCNAGAACQQNDVVNFIISQSDFSKIVNSTANGNIYNAGIQKVSCGFSGNIKANFNKANTGTTDYQYYLGVSFSSYNLAITKVYIKGTGMTQGEELKLQTSKWSWNKDKIALKFPAKLALQSASGESVIYSLDSSPDGGVYLDTGVQFKAFTNANTEKKCGMGLVPQYIYQNSLTQGWNTAGSWNNYGSVDLSSTDIGSNAPSSVSGTIIQTKLQAYGGLQFTRDGGFSTSQLSKLSFAMKTSIDNPEISIFFNSNSQFSFKNASTSWGIYSIDVSSLSPKASEYSISFQNLVNSDLQLWMDNVQWIFTDGATQPAVNVTVAPDPSKPITTSATSSGVSSGVSSGTGATSGSGFTDSDIPSQSGENEVSQSEHTGSSSHIIPSILFISILNFLILLSFL